MTSNPQTITVREGGTASFSVTAGDDPPLNFLRTETGTGGLISIDDNVGQAAARYYRIRVE